MPNIFQTISMMAADRPAVNLDSMNISISGLNVCIESPKGTKKIHADGTSTKLLHHYGFVKGIKGDDGDSLDCYVGPHTNAQFGYLVNQLDIQSGEADEKKLMLGFPSAGSALTAYLAMYPKKMFGGMDSVDLGPKTISGYTNAHKNIQKHLDGIKVSAGGPGSGEYLHKKTGIHKKPLKGKPKKALALNPEAALLKKKKRENFLEKQRHEYKKQATAKKKAGLSVRGKPIVSDKAKRALASMNVATKPVHDLAEKCEHDVSGAIKGTKSGNNSPFDVTFTSKSGKNHGIEVKAVVSQTNDKITMKRGAIDRKQKYAKKNKLDTMSTVVVDYRKSKDNPQVFFKNGVGSFRIGSMTPVKGGLKGLKKMYE